MKNTLSCAQAYKVFYRFLDALYFETYDDELGGFLGSAALYSATPGQCPQTMDAAIWDDWMNAVKVVMQDDAITYEYCMTIEQAYVVMHQYFVRYCQIGSGPSFEILRDLINLHTEEQQVARWFSVRWMQSVEHVLQEDPLKKIGHFFSERTGLIEKESFAVMQVFLDTLCQKNHDLNLIQLIQESRLKHRRDYWALVPDIIEPKIWQVWQQAIVIATQQEDNKALNLLSSYKAMSIFLINYFGNHITDFIKKIINFFQDCEYEKPRNFPCWSSWIDAAYKVDAEQRVVCYGIISINTPISEDAAFKIMNAWFAEYKKLLGDEFVETVFLNTSALQLLWQQAIDVIKQKQRSYLLLDDEVTILETYQIMLKCLELSGKNVSKFAVDETGKPKDFFIMLQWIRICEQKLIM